MVNKKTKDGRFIIRNATPLDTMQMEQIQRICFPTLAPNEILTQDHYTNHQRIFPAGQLVIVDRDKVIASSSTFKTSWGIQEYNFMEATDHLWITNAHQPDGGWLYQFDIAVLPEYRRLKLSTELYRTQQELVNSWGMKGQITVGMTIGYANYRDQFSIEEYCELLKNNRLTDPTITPQLKAGFQWIKPIYNYVDDPTAGNCSVLMAWPAEGASIGSEGVTLSEGIT